MGGAAKNVMSLCGVDGAWRCRKNRARVRCGFRSTRLSNSSAQKNVGEWIGRFAFIYTLCDIAPTGIAISEQSLISNIRLEFHQSAACDAHEPSRSLTSNIGCVRKFVGVDRIGRDIFDCFRSNAREHVPSTSRVCVDLNGFGVPGPRFNQIQRCLRSSVAHYTVSKSVPRACALPLWSAEANEH